MENHHHCSICGDMISPDRKLCFNCEKGPSKKEKVGTMSRSVDDILSDWKEEDEKK